MNDERNNKPDRPDRLEDLLQQWGAEAAAEQQDAPPAPREGVRQLPWMWRYVVPAAAVVFIALLAVWGPIRGMRRQTAERRDVHKNSTEAADPSVALREELVELRKRHTEEVGKLRAEVATLRNQRDELKIAADEAGIRVQELKTSNEDYRRQIADVGETVGRLRQFEQELAALQGRMNRLQVRLAEQSRQAELTAGRARRLQADRLRILGHMRELYLAASAPGEQGMAAVRIAARKNQLLHRMEVLRSSGLAADAAETLEKAEALLLRLAMLPGGDPQAAGAWMNAVQRSGIVADIDKALLADPPPGLEQWLLETRAIFSEASHVG